MAENDYQYYFGVQMPNMAIFLINNNNDLIPYNGKFPDNALISKDKTIENIMIDSAWPSGTYQLLALKTANSDTFKDNPKNSQLLKTAININKIETNRLIQQNLRGECIGQLINNHQYTSFTGSTADYVAGDTNQAYDAFVCNTSTGVYERVSLNEQEQEFSGHTYEASISDNGQWIAFNYYADGNVSSEIYLYDRKKQESTWLTPSVDVGYLGNFQISGNGQAIVFQSTKPNLVDNITPEYQGLYLWEQSTKRIKYIADDTNGQPVINYDGSIIVFDSSADGLTGENDSNYQSNLYLYENESGNIVKLTQNLENLNNSNAVPFFTERHWTSYPVISKDGQVIVYQIDDAQVRGIFVPYLAVFDRKTNTSNLIKPANGTQAIFGDFGNISLSDNGRFILFSSGQVFPLGNNYVPHDPGPYIYLFDRLTQQLEIVASNVDNFNLGLKISGDGYSYRLGDNLYSLPNNSPAISKSSFKTGEILQINLPEAPQGYNQYFGIKNPEGDIFIYSSPENSYLYNGNNLLPYQGKRLILNEIINKEQWFPGQYQAYLLTLPATLKPSAFPNEWILGTTPFEIVY